MAPRTSKKVARAAPRAPSPAPAVPVVPSWTFLSNHAHVLLCLAENADPTVREVALRVGITERAVHKILAELEEGGYLSRHRDGRRNTYVVHGERPLRHPIEAHRTLDDLIDVVLRG
jgi:DNA-binding transcriptional ArsR family regulator